MGRFTTMFAAIGLAGAAWFASAAGASAATCPTNESFFGTVQRMSGDMLTVSTQAGRWANVRIDRNARINKNGSDLDRGAYIGAFGCVTPDGVFHASEITLARNASRYHETLTGIVERVEPGRILVKQYGHGYGTWYVSDSSRFRAGERLSGVGMIGDNGAFYPQTVNSETTAYDPDDTSPPSVANANTITLTGIVRKVNGGSLLVWEPNVNHSGTWIVRDAGKYRVGQHLVATGTEDRSGNFYPSRISIQ